MPPPSRHIKFSPGGGRHLRAEISNERLESTLANYRVCAVSNLIVVLSIVQMHIGSFCLEKQQVLIFFICCKNFVSLIHDWCSSSFCHASPYPVSCAGSGRAGLGKGWGWDVAVRSNPRPRHLAAQPLFGPHGFLEPAPTILQAQI